MKKSILHINYVITYYGISCILKLTSSNLKFISPLIFKKSFFLINKLVPFVELLSL